MAPNNTNVRVENIPLKLNMKVNQAEVELDPEHTFPKCFILEVLRAAV